MRPASLTHSTYLARPTWRSRAASLSIALALVALLVLILLRMGGLRLPPPGGGRPLSTFDVAPPGPKAAPAQRRTQRQEKRAERRVAPPRAAPPPPTLPPPPIVLPGVITLSRADFAASNIGRIPRAADDAGGATALADSGGGAPDDDGGGGGGPNGERLYNAEWVREPTRAELVTYLPPRRESGWGMVMCRTIERNRVEDCREMGETPGSGIARGLRQAAWQFLVRPPRVNGRPLVGAWVRIRFDLKVGITS